MLGILTPRVFMGHAQRRLLRRGTLILAYHKLGKPPPGVKDPFLYDTADDLEEHLRLMRQHGIQHATLDQCAAENFTQPNTCVITFDDGTLDSLKLGVPVFDKYRVRATQFLVSDFLGGRNEWDIRKGDHPAQLMTVAQVREWISAGHAIGSHSRTHRNLRKLSSAEAKEEIAGSKKALEDTFGVPIRHFAYPFGSWNPEIRDFVAEAGYETACSMDFGVASARSHRHSLERAFPISGLRLLAKATHRIARKFG